MSRAKEVTKKGTAPRKAKPKGKTTPLSPGARAEFEQLMKEARAHLDEGLRLMAEADAEVTLAAQAAKRAGLAAVG